MKPAWIGLFGVLCGLSALARAEPGAVLDERSLGQLRGGSDVRISDIRAGGNVAQNEASNLTTGANFVVGGSFANASGFPTVVQNSGNNVLIQNSTIINLTLQ